MGCGRIQRCHSVRLRVTKYQRIELPQERIVDCYIYRLIDFYQIALHKKIELEYPPPTEYRNFYIYIKHSIVLLNF